MNTVFREQPVASSSYKRPVLSDAEIDRANTLLADAGPQQILEWAVYNVPGLFQTTAFGLSGLAATDMLSKIFEQHALPGEPAQHKVPLIFLDTLYHFPETLSLADQISRKYGADLHVYTPQAVSNTQQFETMYGQRLWETDEETYDYLVKAEPAQRAYTNLNVAAVLTGRRRSQGSDRASLKIVEKDASDVIKINPLANWSFSQVKAYIDANNVPYNALLDQGYRSIGDWHSTKASNGVVAKDIGADAEERAGRWAGRKEKTECGLHKDFFKMKMAFQKAQREKELANRDNSRTSTILPEPVPSIEV